MKDPLDVLRWLVVSSLLVHVYIAILITIGFIAYFT